MIGLEGMVVMDGGLGEIFDGQPPFAPQGCIAQAWTVAEVLRAWHTLQTSINKN